MAGSSGRVAVRGADRIWPSFTSSARVPVRVQNIAAELCRAVSGRRARWRSLREFAVEMGDASENGPYAVSGPANTSYRRLHSAGAHPGLSDQDDSTFRLHLVLLVARMLLRRI